MKKTLWLALMMSVSTMLGYAQNPVKKESLEFVITKGHKKSVNSLDYHPSGQYIVTAGQDLSLKIWDMALQQEFRTLYGHKQTIKKVCYSPDGQYIASVDRHQTILWKHPEGTIVKKIKTRDGTALFTADSKQLLVQGVTTTSGFSGNLALYNTATGQFVKEYKKINLAESGASLHPNNRWLFNNYKWLDLETGEDRGTLKANDKPAFWTLSAVSKTHFAAHNHGSGQINVWQLPNLQKNLYTIQLPDKQMVKKMLYTSDGKYLVVGTDPYRFLVYAVANGKLLKSITLPNYYNVGFQVDPKQTKLVQQGALNDFVISPDNRSILANAQVIAVGGKATLVGIQSTIGVRLIDIKNGQEQSVFGGTYSEVARFSVSKNEKQLVTMQYGRINGVQVWNLRKGEIEAFIPIQASKEVYANDEIVAVYEAATREIIGYALPELKEQFKLKMPGSDYPTKVYISDNNQVLAYQTYQQVGGKYAQYLKCWNISGGTTPKLIKQVKLAGQLEQVKITPGGKYALLRLYLSSPKGWSRVVQSIELATNKTVMNYPIVNQSDYLLGFRSTENSVLVVKQVNKPDKGGFFVHLLKVNYTNGQVTDSLVTDYELVNDAQFSSDGRYLVTGSGGYGQAQNIHFDVAVWDWKTKKQICLLRGHNADLKQVWFGPKGKKIYSLDNNSVVKIWDFEKCRLNNTLISLQEKDYLILNAENYYKTSKNNIYNIAFRYQGKLRPFGQFDLRFNRPDLVIKALGGSKITQRMYHRAWKKRLQRAGVIEAQLTGVLHLPEVTILNKRSLPVATTQRSINISLKAQDTQVALQRLQVFANGVPVYTQALTGNQFSKTLKIPLSLGVNQVSVVVSNAKGLKSLKESLRVECKASAKKPDLYVLAIGVSEYTNVERNLKFAVKDANNLTDALKNAKNYGKIVIKKILNKEASKTNILRTAEFLAQTAVDDQVIIYISCHGLLDADLNYYLATTDVDFENPANNGLPYEAIEQMLEKVPARRRLIMIDACHSGELDKSEIEVANQADKQENLTITFKGGTKLIKPKAGLKNSFDYMKALFNDVSNQSGATIISAAAGYEFALESKEWNNGVFTYAVLKGLQVDTQDNADINNDGKVSVSELKEYVIAKVVDLTNGQQVPTTRRENQSVEVVLFEPKK
ncbi:MAG TPA: hypothetical protein DCS93_44365 [Microscillaceae bacterium]|nr:hypothetical protein [Microscillaceae bacterium]